MDQLEKILQSFNPISLGEMDNVKLMDRTDTKFVFRADYLPGILQQAAPGYRILEIDGKRLFAYETLYLDTADDRMYLTHHNGKQNRYKIRFRKYVDTDKTFLEIKFKSNKGRTSKTRIRRKKVGKLDSKKAMEFIEGTTPFKYASLEQKIWNRFSRLTLVHKSVSERITVDVNLRYFNERQEADLSYLAIAEIKQEKLSSGSEFIRLLTSKKIFPAPFSKYCQGRILLDKKLKNNRFKHRLITLNKLSHDNRFYHLIG